MPRRLDPRAGLPGLFERGRAKSDELDFLVRPGKRVRSRKKAPAVAVPVPDPDPDPVPAVAVAVVTPTPPPAIPVELRDAPPPRRVPDYKEPPLEFPSIVTLATCTLGWAASCVRSFVRSRLAS